MMTIQQPDGGAGTHPGIARLALDVYLPHLDRFFDYSIPDRLAQQVQLGCRVRARFAGRMANGFVVGLPARAEVDKLSPLDRVISPEPVLLAQQVPLLRAVADHYAGTFADVMRLAVPPRHAATEAAEQNPWPAPDARDVPGGGLTEVDDGRRFLDAVGQSRPVRAHWCALPRWRSDESGLDDWTRGFVQAVGAAVGAGHGALVIVPDVDRVRRMRDVLRAVLGPGCVAELHSELGPAARYRNYLAVSRGQARVLVGTRGASYAPVHDLGVICLWDDGDDLLSEPRAPYPHARDVAALRATQESCALLFGSYARTAEMQAWVSTGWLVPLGLAPARTRRLAPPVRAAVDSDIDLQRDPMAAAARVPKEAFETIRTGLLSGPVLVQVPRAGYLVALSCQRCRTPVRCPTCGGPVGADRLGAGQRRLTCRWCGRSLNNWSCPVCGSRELRAPVVGSQRTAEELGRAFPSFRLVGSSAQKVVDQVGATPALVVATPGAEPRPEAGYSAAVLLDAGLMLTRADLRAAEESYRRWLTVVSLVRSGDQGGTVSVVGPAEERTVQALVRLDPAGFAERELSDRQAAGFPPAVRMVAVEADEKTLADFRSVVEWPSDAQELGPVPIADSTPGSTEQLWRLMVRIDRTMGGELIVAARRALSIRSARKRPGAVRVRVDPIELF
ncbi:Primosomal protein N' PriA [Propionibacterium freudenreichii]|nr:Primosomal protein N' PriA [Propionibacterium freudenreichii]SCQ68691.1 Primosomal protein N' PriA [Propionibacterium freudenreichii]